MRQNGPGDSKCLSEQQRFGPLSLRVPELVCIKDGVSWLKFTQSLTCSHLTTRSPMDLKLQIYNVHLVYFQAALSDFKSEQQARQKIVTRAHGSTMLARLAKL